MISRHITNCPSSALFTSRTRINGSRSNVKICSSAKRQYSSILHFSSRSSRKDSNGWISSGKRPVSSELDTVFTSQNRCFSIWPQSKEPEQDRSGASRNTLESKSSIPQSIENESSSSAQTGLQLTDYSEVSLDSATITPSSSFTELFTTQAVLESDSVGTFGHIVNQITTFFNIYFDSIHTITGLPWYLSIPVSAAFIRCGMFGLFTLPTLRANGRRGLYTPQLSFSTHWIRNAALGRRNSSLASTVVSSRSSETSFSRSVNKHIKAQIAAETWRHGLQVGIYRYLPFLPIPVFIFALDTLRRMCGIQAISFFGLRSMFGDHGSTEVPGKAAEALAAISQRTAEAAGTDISEIASSSISDLQHSIVSVYEASLMQGGALWFPDLTVPDPTSILSIGIFFSMWLIMRPKISNILGRSRSLKERPSPNLKSSMFREIGIKSGYYKLPQYSFISPSASRPAPQTLETMNLHEFLIRTRDFSLLRKFTLAMKMPQFAIKTDRLVFSVIVAAAYLSMQLPAGLVLYWITNSITATGCRIAVTRWLKLRPPATIGDQFGTVWELRADPRGVGNAAVFKSRKLSGPDVPVGSPKIR